MRPGWLLLLVALLVTLVLRFEQNDIATQCALGAATMLALSLMVRRARATNVKEVTAAIVIATAGECILSLWWGLYEYRSGLIPLYVPFGHGIFYLLAAETATADALKRRARGIQVAVLAASGAWAVLRLGHGDEWGFLWWVIAAGFMIRSSHPLLLSLCYIYTFALEIAGTSMGNWRWASEVPGLGLGSGNPPSGVGVLYCVLDVCTLAGVGFIDRYRLRNARIAGGRAAAFQGAGARADGSAL